MRLTTAIRPTDTAPAAATIEQLVRRCHVPTVLGQQRRAEGDEEHADADDHEAAGRKQPCAHVSHVPSVTAALTLDGGGSGDRA